MLIEEFDVESAGNELLKRAEILTVSRTPIVMGALLEGCRQRFPYIVLEMQSMKDGIAKVDPERIERLQSLFPPEPVLEDGEEFIPESNCTADGVVGILQCAQKLQMNRQDPQTNSREHCFEVFAVVQAPRE